MSIAITRQDKNTLYVDSPVMPASGTFGFGEVYKDFVKLDKLGAIVTNPVTYEAWTAASGTRVIHMDSGFLMHTGLPNPGLNKVLKEKRSMWSMIPVPVILHLVATTEDHVRKSAARLDEEDSVEAIELGLNDDISWEEAETLTRAATARTEKPVLVRLPLQDAYEIAQAVADAGAGALVISAPPRGTARDPYNGRLVSGRIYGPLVKPIVLRVVGQLARRLDGIPIIGAGGIHNTQDARDYIDAGARAVQVDSLTWVEPHMLEVIGRDLGGWIVTRATGAFPDEWHPGMGDTEFEEMMKERNQDQDDSAATPT